MLNYNLLTLEGEKLEQNNVLKDYPRPQFRRDSYLNLNGIWKYEINKSGKIEGEFSNDILVPFPIESTLSKVKRILKKDEYLIYKLIFNTPKNFIKDITYLNFGAVDQICKVVLNNIELGTHKGGYLPFSFNITKVIKEKNNELYVIVKDENSYLYPTGKQRKKRGGIFYTPTSGIWQSVWIESTGKEIINNIKITPDIDKSCVNLKIKSDAKELELTIKEKNKIIYKNKIKDFDITIKIDNPKYWDNDNPFLYDIEIKSKNDKVYSYFAMRKIEIKNNKIYLNNKELFINGVLDQGYFSDGIYTPASYEVYKNDILTMKGLGFNTLRKHIKIEPMMFYYYCDTLGMLVMQDFVNIGKYSIIRHGLFPFKFRMTHLRAHDLNKTQRNNFINHSKEIIDCLYNVPSIIYYTIFNEGWGEFKPDYLYDLVTAIDHSRIIDATSGWFIAKKSDVYSYHIYKRPIKLKKKDRPIIVSEFGAYCHRVKNHCFNEELSTHTTYNMYQDLNSLENRIIKTYTDEVIPMKEKGLCGVVYTQLSDVEDEVNGILTYDRKICKLNKNKLNKIIKKVY